MAGADAEGFERSNLNSLRANKSRICHPRPGCCSSVSGPWRTAKAACRIVQCESPLNSSRTTPGQSPRLLDRSMRRPASSPATKPRARSVFKSVNFTEAPAIRIPKETAFGLPAPAAESHGKPWKFHGKPGKG